jgi:hypothetical protein
MNWKRSIIAALSGVACLAAPWVDVWVGLYLMFSEPGSAGWFGGIRLIEIPLWLSLVGVIIVSMVAALFLMLPARMLGADWRRSCIAALAAGFVFVSLVFIVLFPTPFKAGWILLALVAMPSAMVIYAIHGRVSRSTIIAVAVAATILFAASSSLFIVFPGSVESLIVAAASWPALPALAGALILDEA